jgi:hypothetical protein
MADQYAIRPVTDDEHAAFLLVHEHSFNAARGQEPRRAYADPVDVVLEVTDELLTANAGRWRLRAAGLGGSDGSVSCARTDDPADIALNPSPWCPRVF